jgi:competence protein ComEA
MEPLSRPMPPRSPAERFRTWAVWFGVGRLVAASVATVAVCAGGVWLVRTPPPPTEASLPRASATTGSTGSSEPVDRTQDVVAAPTTDPVVLVHVAGAVVEPGVYQLVGDARVRDAIVAAGGPTATADWNALNLAASISDGVKVYVPNVGEELPPSLTALPADPSGSIPIGPIDVNAATADELESLPGVGPSTATAIVTERERNGPFLDVDDLDRVPGIGPAKLEALRGLVTT